MLTKENVLKSLQDLPDKFSVDELLDKIFLLYKIETGLEQLKNGQFMSLEEAKKRHEEWLK